ncbi:hypothetical protein HN51_068205 [Arachis hypogaea]|uniref:non-specific serine/threonine protein kinase n=1 Tax=Arachis hypogaea TaxID=3818 RepID=A0A445DA20_ARAHY|nr:LEAF RUST 10 DISEASE-RESISTANCE LOCUS RECEPTOR-LIKE PROTEIN KINASE-like 1.4 isoform X3 [Arachis ipaensis]XP_025650500.1 LEAF RUST 10 DISEASE-RESISTANCE LOCUS RECEPTOR-LIKE PROTEIN KINASE-like 1.4 isoform X2 [Arachis hypogaea]XP_025697237.1 LEAF RUST 10 DISEASE-RESISTANCE LOCUS RECEPTOR-LIKE PROTEIN KINASE-like 1.4 isoform X3 [Arachis hypogaea]RYR60017.1 hypothetical protein Ahy_A04g017127 isoform E [Arachis hypogaea]
MKQQTMLSLSSFSSFSITIFFFFIFIFSLLHPTTPLPSNASFSLCSNTTFNCGNITNVSYPFTGADRPFFCGPPEFHLTCNDGVPELNILLVRYRVLQLDSVAQSLTIARADLWNNTCTNVHLNSTIDDGTSSFTYGSGNKNLTLFYGCGPSMLNITPVNLFHCDSGYGNKSDSYSLIGPLPMDPILSIVHCELGVEVPILEDQANRLIGNRSLLREVLMKGFNVSYSNNHYESECLKCVIGDGGQCGFDFDSNKVICICDDQLCSSSGKSTNKAAIAAGATSGAVVFVVLLIGTLFVIRRRRRNAERSRSNKDILPLSGVPLTSSTTSSSNTSQSVSSYPSSKSDSVPKSYYYGVQVFDYAELEEATNNFDPSRELGEGGFGTVYKGMLQDGRVVAVKRHYESHLKRVEQYMNEVELLAHLRHKNLVTLFGCTSRHSRELILVYEFIPNGTLADHLHGSLANSTLLTWNVRYKVALETAEALSYLHSKKVIHRDVKSTNILLTETFQVKVGDFGLSRLFPKFVTHVSTAPQGTPGYVDPEYYQNYQLTDKSDVYSFGVVLVELISSLQAVDITRNRNEVNLASLAVNRIQNQELHDMVDPCLGFEKDNDVRRMVTAVAELAFRCLQQQRDMRPSMDEVLEILRGVKGDEFGALERNSSESAVGVNHNKTEEVILLKKVLPPVSPDSVADKWVSSSSTSSTS